MGQSTVDAIMNQYKKNTEKKSTRKVEFSLKNYPIGPLKRNQKIKLPIEDVKKLLDEKKVLLSKEHSLFWSCRKNESFVSKEIKKLNLEIKKIAAPQIQQTLLQESNFNEYFSQSCKR
jgi:N-acetylmuramoyl-L-alanine amidase CwlA